MRERTIFDKCAAHERDAICCRQDREGNYAEAAHIVYWTRRKLQHRLLAVSSQSRRARVGHRRSRVTESMERRFPENRAGQRPRLPHGLRPAISFLHRRMLPQRDEPVRLSMRRASVGVLAWLLGDAVALGVKRKPNCANAQPMVAESASPAASAFESRRIGKGRPQWARCCRLDATRGPSAPHPNEPLRRRRADNSSVDRLAVIMRRRNLNPRTAP